MSKLVDWIDTHNVAWHSYFNRYDPLDGIGSYKINTLIKTGASQFPNAAQMFLQKLGS